MIQDNKVKECLNEIYSILKKYGIELNRPNTPLIGSCEILYSGDPSIRVGGSNKIFKALFVDGDGNEIAITPHWQLDFSKYPELAGRINIVSESEDNVKINASDSRIINKSFILKVSSESDEYGYFENQLEISLDDLW